jgi:hypothetical protein
MIKNTLPILDKMGVSPGLVYTSIESRTNFVMVVAHVSIQPRVEF